MKKSIFLGIAIVFVLFLSSCNRTWVCECKTSSGVVPIEISDLNKKEAKDACQTYSLSNLYNTTGGCELQ